MRFQISGLTIELGLYKIYKITSPTGLVYIGRTKQEGDKRFKFKTNYYHNKRFLEDAKAYGWKSFLKEVLIDGLTEEESKQKEIEYIYFFDSANPAKGYNITLGGESGNGYHHTEDAKRRIGEAGRGRPSPMRGKTHSEEAKAKISHSNKGIVRRRGFVLSEDTKRKISQANKGILKPKSREQALKLSKAKIGKKLTSETKQKMSKSRMEWFAKHGVKILQLSLDGYVLNKWNTQSEACRDLGIKQSTFQLHVSNGKPLGGFIYIKENTYIQK